MPKDRWRENLSPAEGGGILLDLHTHLVDAAVQLFGSVATVFATVAARTTPAEDDAFLVCRHSSGVVSHLGATSLSGAPGPRVRLLGTEAAYVLADFSGEFHPWSGQADTDAAQAGWLYRGDAREPVERASSTQADLYRSVVTALDVRGPAGRDARGPVGRRAHARRDRCGPHLCRQGSASSSWRPRSAEPSADAEPAGLHGAPPRIPSPSRVTM